MACMDMDDKDWVFEALRRLIALWESRRPGPGLMPARADFDMPDFRDLLGWVCMADIEYTPAPRLRIRLEGSQVCELDGGDWTGRYLDEKFDPAAHPEVFEPYFRAMERREPVLVRREIPIGGDRVRHLAKLILPLARDGVTPDQCINVLYFENRWRDWVPPGSVAL